MTDQALRRRSSRFAGGGFALSLLLAIHLLNHLDRHILTAVFPLIQAEWQLNDAQLGLAATLVSLGRVLVMFPAGWLADRRGRLWMLRLADASWGGLAVLSGLAGQFWQFLLLRAGVGLADGANGPADIAFLSEAFPQERRGRAVALYSLGMYTGSTLGFAFGAVVGEQWSWRLAFVVPGLLGCLLGGLVFRLRAPDTWTAAPGDTPGARAAPLRLTRAMASRPVVGGLLGGVFGLMALTALMSWTPTFMYRYHGSSVAQAGLASSLVFLPAGVLGTLLGGWLSDRWVRVNPAARFYSAALGLWLGLPAAALAVFAPSWLLYLLSAFLAGICLSSFLIPFNVLAQESAAPAWRATTMAVALLTSQLGGSIGVGLVGLLSDASDLRTAMLLPLAAALLAGLSFLAGGRMCRACPGSSVPGQVS